MAADAAGAVTDGDEPPGRVWLRQVGEQLADPHARPFVASIPFLFVLGGEHTGFDYCWCQPTMTMHGCGHRHGQHRETMD